MDHASREAITPLETLSCYQPNRPACSEKAEATISKVTMVNDLQ